MDCEGTKIIACRTVIEEMQHLLPSHTVPLSLEAGLHLSPDGLRDALQRVIDGITVHAKTIILGYGLCSMGVIGLRAAHSTLVIPRMDDCLALFLGSRAVYKKALDQEPGTYFLSRGWINAGITLLDDLEKMRARYDTEVSKRIMKRMLQHYRRLVFIDMGYADPEPYRQFSRKAARQLNLDYQEISGNPEFLAKIYHGPWDDEFLVCPPGQIVRLEDFGMFPARE